MDLKYSIHFPSVKRCNGEHVMFLQSSCKIKQHTVRKHLANDKEVEQQK